MFDQSKFKMDEKQDLPKTAVEELDFLNDVIPYRCPKCGDNRKFSKLGDLKLHLEADHSYKVGYVKPRTRVKVFSHSATKGGNKSKNETCLKKLSENDMSSDNSWKNGTGSDCDSQSEKRAGKVNEKRRGEREISPLLQSYKQDAKALEMKIKMAKESEMKRRLERNILDNKSSYEFRSPLNDMNTEVLQARQKEWQMADALYQSHDVLLSMEQAAEKRCREQQEVIQDIVNEFKFKENQLAQANTDLEKLKSERERLMLETENLLKSADKGQEHLREELSKREELLSSISDELETVKVLASQELQKKDGELEETKGKLESLATERDLLLKETAELSDKAGQHSSLLKRTLEVKERQLRKVNKEMEKLKTEQNSLVEESINLYKTANDGNNKLKDLVKLKDNQLSQAYQELGQMKELHEKLVWEANQLTKQADENNEKLKALFRSKEEQLLDAQVELERVKTEQKMLLESAKGLQDKVECADEKVNELQSVVSQKEKQLAQKEKELESIQSFLSSTAEKESVARDKLEKFISELIDRADNAERELVVLKSRSNSNTSGSPKHLPAQQSVHYTGESDADISHESSIIFSDISDSEESLVRSKTKGVLPDSKMGNQTSVVPLQSAASDILNEDDSSAYLPQKLSLKNFAGADHSEMESKARNNQKKEEVQELLHAGIDIHDVPNLVNTTNFEQKTLDDFHLSKSRIGSYNTPKDLTHLTQHPNSAPQKPPRHLERTPIHNPQKSNMKQQRQKAETIPIIQQQNLESNHRQIPESKQWQNAKPTAVYQQQNSESHGQHTNQNTTPIDQQQIHNRISVQPQYQNTGGTLTIQPPTEFLDSDDTIMGSDSNNHAYNSMPQNQDFQKCEKLCSDHENNYEGSMSPVYLEELGNAKINVSRFMNSEETLGHKKLEKGAENTAKIVGSSVNDPKYFADTIISKPGNTHYQQKIKTNDLHNHSAHRRKPYDLHLYGGQRFQNGLAESCQREITSDSQTEAFKISKVPEQVVGHTVKNQSNLVLASKKNGTEVFNTQKYPNFVSSGCLIDKVENLDIPKSHHSERVGCTRNHPQNVQWKNDINLLNADKQKYNTVHNLQVSEFNSDLPLFLSSKQPHFESETGKTMPVIPAMSFPNTANIDRQQRKPVSNIRPMSYQNTENMDMWTGKPSSDVQQPISFQITASLDKKSGNPISDIKPYSFGITTNTEGQLLSMFSHEPIKRLPEDKYQNKPELGTDNDNLYDLLDGEDDQDHSLNDIISIPEYENFFNEPEDDEKSISEFHEIMDDNGILWDIKYQNTDYGLYRKNQNTPALSNNSERDKRRLHVGFQNENQIDDTKFNLKSRSAESSGSFSCDSYTPIQRSNGVMPNLSDKEVFSDDIDELTDLNTIYNSKSPSLESLKSVSSDSYLSIQKRDAKIQTLSDHGKYSNAEESNCHESNYSLKSPSTGSLVSMSSDSYIPIQRRDAKTQTVDTELKLMADNKAKQNLKSPSSESLGSLSSDSYLPLTKSGIRLEYDSSVYNRGVPLSGRILPRQDNMPKIRNSSTQTWLLDRHISSANIELIRERSPLVENRTLLDDKYKNSQFFSDVPWNKMKENDKQRLGEFIIDKAMLRSEIDRRIEEKLQTRNKVLHENDPEIPLIFSQANKSYLNGNIEFDKSNRKISNVEREQYIGEHSLGSKVNTEKDQILKSDVCSTEQQKDLADDKSTPNTESVNEKTNVLRHDGGSVTTFKDQSALDKKIFDTKDTVLNAEREQEMVTKGGFSSESVGENSSKIKNKNELCTDKKNISSSQSNNKTSNLGNEKVTKDRDSQLNESEFEQEVMTDFAKREFKPKVSSEENGSEDLHSPVSMDTLNDSGINISSSNDFNTEVVHEENIHRHVSPQTALKNRSFSIDEDGTCTQSERSFPSNNSKLEMEISTYGNENGHNQEASTKGKSLDNCQLKTSVDQDEHCVQLDHTYDENNIESSWLAKQKQSQDAMLADFTDTDADDDYCQSLTSIEDYRERMSITSSLDSRVDTSVYRKREEIRNRRHALFQIFLFLDTKSLVDIALVCREWRKVSRQSGLWKKVSLTYRKISTKFLMTISSWCTQTEHLILEGLQPRDIYEGESREGYNSKISGSLEPGLERLLQQSESTLKSIRIVNCGRLLTDKSIWLVSCYSRVIKSICYISDTYPLGADVMWAVGSGCRDLNTLIIPPKYPCSSPEKFDNKCLQIISQCCHDLVKLSIGGSLIDINGLVLVAKSCQRLLELEIHYSNDITEDIATAICRLGLNPLQCLRFIHTPVDDKAILQFYKSCKHLKLIQIDLSASDYVDDLVNEDNVKIFKKYTDKLTKLCKKPGLGNILKLHLNEAS